MHHQSLGPNSYRAIGVISMLGDNEAIAAITLTNGEGIKTVTERLERLGFSNVRTISCTDTREALEQQTATAGARAQQLVGDLTRASL